MRRQARIHRCAPQSPGESPGPARAVAPNCEAHISLIAFALTPLSGCSRSSLRIRPRGHAASISTACSGRPARRMTSSRSWHCPSHPCAPRAPHRTGRSWQVVGVPSLEDVLAGFNGTILAYGQTGTGAQMTNVPIEYQSTSGPSTGHTGPVGPPLLPCANTHDHTMAGATVFHTPSRRLRGVEAGDASPGRR